MRKILALCPLLAGFFLFSGSTGALSAQTIPFEYYIVAVSPDESMVAAVATDYTLQILDAQTGSLIFDLTGLPDGVSPFSIAWNAQSTEIATGGGDEIIRIWCVDRQTSPSCTPGVLIREITENQSNLLAVAWSADGKLATIGQIGYQPLRVWDSKSNFAVIASGSQGDASQLVWYPGNIYLMLADRYEGIYIAEINATYMESVVFLTRVPALSMTWNSVNSRLAVGSYDGKVSILAPTTPTPSTPLTPISVFEGGHTSEVYSVVWSPDDMKIASSERSGNLIVRDVVSGEGYFIENHKTYASNLAIDWSATTGLIFASDTGIVGLGTNAAPTAQAGSDQTVTGGDGNGSRSVALDGSGSRDDVVIVDYVWSENGVELARGIQPQVNLASGVHTLTLTVTDDDGATDTDMVTITV